MSQKQQQDESVIVKFQKAPVRLSYPVLFEARSFKGPDGKLTKPAFSASFILDIVKNAEDIKAVQAAIEKIKQSKWPGKKLILKQCCLHSGDEKPDTDGYGSGIMYVSARNEKRPGVVDRDLTPLTAEDGKPYAGCYVYGTIRLWAQDNDWGKGVNASLRNVQFVRDGEPFGEKQAAPEEEFSALPDDDQSPI